LPQTQVPNNEPLEKNMFFIIPSSLFHGIINQNGRRHTGMTEEDEALLLEAMWHGTKNLISRSNLGNSPVYSYKLFINLRIILSAIWIRKSNWSADE
jgi:hypothetical protein